MAEPKSWARDFFLSLMHSALLLGVVYHFGSLLFSYIDTVGTGSGYVVHFTWNLAALIVMLPMFLILRHWIESIGPNALLLSSHDGARPLIGKWSYFLLSLSGVVIISDLVFLLYMFLEGGLFWEFGMKMAVVFVLGLLVFSYAGYALRYGNIGWRPAFSTAIVAIAVTVALGFLAGGSPLQRRKETADMRTSNMLSGWYDALSEHYYKHSELPRRLEDTDISSRPWFRTDGELKSRSLPEYRILNKRTYVLCAEFQTLQVSSVYWTHHAGKECFVETVKSKE